ncbi:MAG: flippase-like domain-containing protein [Chlorobi bacterium]|nr:flippase-like domain-containing protein [Chlorobiota bacterium]
MKYVKYLIFLAIGLFFLWLAFRNVDLQEFISGFREVNWTPVVLSMIVAVISHWFRGLRWRLLIRSQGNYNLSRMDAFSGVMVGYLSNLALPRMGEVIRCTIVGKYTGIPVSFLFGTVVLERIIDLLILIILLAMVIPLQINVLGDFIREHLLSGLPDSKTITIIAIIVVLAVLLAILFLYFGFVMWVRNAPFSQKRLAVRIRAMVRNLINGLKTVFKLPVRVQVYFWTYTLLIWVLYIVMTWLPALAMPTTQNMSFAELMGMFVMGSLGIVAPVQGGIGTYHWLVQQTLMLYGYDATTGLQLATLIHTSQTLMVIIVGFLAFLYFAIRKK